MFNAYYKNTVFPRVTRIMRSGDIRVTEVLNVGRIDFIVVLRVHRFHGFVKIHSAGMREFTMFRFRFRRVRFGRGHDAYTRPGRPPGSSSSRTRRNRRRMMMMMGFFQKWSDRNRAAVVVVEDPIGTRRQQSGWRDIEFRDGRSSAPGWWGQEELGQRIENRERERERNKHKLSEQSVNNLSTGMVWRRRRKEGRKEG